MCHRPPTVHLEPKYFNAMLLQRTVSARTVQSYLSMKLIVAEIQRSIDRLEWFEVNIDSFLFAIIG